MLTVQKVHPSKLLITAESLVAHTAAVVVAPVLMIAGLGLCMSIVLMPFGLTIGLAGTLMLFWGLTGPR